MWFYKGGFVMAARVPVGLVAVGVHRVCQSAVTGGHRHHAYVAVPVPLRQLVLVEDHLLRSVGQASLLAAVDLVALALLSASVVHVGAVGVWHLLVRFLHVTFHL
eukprot:722645-Prorocentrum_minimum.AAC.2